MNKLKKGGRLTHVKNVGIIKMLREGHYRQDTIIAALPKDCHLRSKKFMALVIMAEIVDETGQDIIPRWQICQACKEKECPHKK